MLPPRFSRTPQYPIPFPGIRHSFTQRWQGTPSESSGGRSGSPKALLLRTWASRATGRARSGFPRMQGRHTASSLAILSDVALQIRQVPMPVLPPCAAMLLSRNCIPQPLEGKDPDSE
jgi:hypothetical protein